ncbi:MAG: hypothetical protein ACOZAL_01615 [Patescibacteria group bacterium]
MKALYYDVENLKQILGILKLKNLSQKDLRVCKGLAYYTIKKVIRLFLGYSNKEAEKVLVKALDCEDKIIKFLARYALLEAERLGKRLHKRTLLRLKAIEEEII